jgi:hypothetical protein
MKGLLLNDWYIMWKQCWLQLICIIIFGVFSIIGDNQSFFLFVVLYSALLPQTIMAYNEKNKWDRMALTMPVSRDQVVGERYLMSLIMVTLAFIMCIAFSIIKSIIGGGDFQETLQYVLLMAGATIIVNSIYMPVIFKFGMERARLCVIIIAGAVGAVVYMVASGEASGLQNAAVQIMNTNIFLFLGVCILIYFLSMLVSMGIYSKKQM